MIQRTNAVRSGSIALFAAIATLGFACGSLDDVGRSDRSVVEHDTTLPPVDHGKVMICKVPPGNPANAHTIVVAQAAEQAHLATGSYLGPCDARCDAPLSSDDHLGHDASIKAHKVAICHIPPGNPGNAHTIVVSKNALEAHLAHGDALGFCSAPRCEGEGGNDDGADTVTEPPAVSDPPPSDPGTDDPAGGDTPPDNGDLSGGGDPVIPPDSCPAGIESCQSNSDCGASLYCHDGCCLQVIVY